MNNVDFRFKICYRFVLVIFCICREIILLFSYIILKYFYIYVFLESYYMVYFDIYREYILKVVKYSVWDVTDNINIF